MALNRALSQLNPNPSLNTIAFKLIVRDDCQLAYQTGCKPQVLLGRVSETHQQYEGNLTLKSHRVERMEVEIVLTSKAD